MNFSNKEAANCCDQQPSTSCFVATASSTERRINPRMTTHLRLFQPIVLATHLHQLRNGFRLEMLRSLNLCLIIKLSVLVEQTWITKQFHGFYLLFFDRFAPPLSKLVFESSVPHSKILHSYEGWIAKAKKSNQQFLEVM